MDVGIRSPLLDFFRRGEVAKDVRLLAARGALAPRAHEQVALLAMLTEDGDSEVRGAAEATLAAIPNEALGAFLGRSDVHDGLREFFLARGVEATPGGSTDDENPLIDLGTDPEPAEGEATGEVDEEAARVGAAQRLSLLAVADKMKAAMKGTKEDRAILIRDSNKLVSCSVLASPKMSESEVANFAKMANVSEEVLRIIGTNRGWTKNYAVIAGLVRNPKTPLAISMRFVQRLNDKDLRMIAMDRNLQEPLKQVVRKRITSGGKEV